MDGERVQVAAAFQRIAGRLRPGGSAVQAVPRLPGGASQQTWALDRVTPGEAGVQPLVLRCSPDASGACMKGTEGLRVEAQLIGVSGVHGVSGPGVRHVLQSGDGLGEGFVMDPIEGETLGRRTVRKERLAGTRRVLARQCGMAMARIHRLSTGQLPPLHSSAAATELDFQIGLHRSHGMARPVFEAALRWLRKHAPANVSAPVLVHGCSAARATNRLNTSTATTGATASRKGPRRSRCARC